MSHMAYPLSTLKVAMFLVERLCGKRFLMDGEFLKKLSKRGKKAYVFTRKAALLIKNFANVSLSKAAKMNLKWMDGDVFHGIVFARKWERKQQISRYVLASLWEGVSIRRSNCRSVGPSVGSSVGHTRVEFLRNGPNLNKRASGIRRSPFKRWFKDNYDLILQVHEDPSQTTSLPKMFFRRLSCHVYDEWTDGLMDGPTEELIEHW